MKRKMKKLNIELLHKLFILKSGGVLVWRNRPDMAQRWNSRYGGTIAGRVTRGYIGVQFSKKRWQVHRVIYAMHYGIDPFPNEIDHIDGDRLNNRPGNLRMAKKSQNHQNLRKLNPRNTSGYRGVTKKKSGKKWQAQVGCNGRCHYLGTFCNIKDADKAAKLARANLFGDFSGDEKNESPTYC